MTNDMNNHGNYECITYTIIHNRYGGMILLMGVMVPYQNTWWYTGYKWCDITNRD